MSKETSCAPDIWLDPQDFSVLLMLLSCCPPGPLLCCTAVLLSSDVLTQASAPVPPSPALSQMGYNLSPQFTQLLVSRYCPRSATPAMQLDCFIKVCTQLQVLTEAFREKDTAVQGHVRLSFEDFVTMTASRML